MVSSTEVKVCYILSYRDSGYIRTRTLVSALQSLEHVELYEACNTLHGLVRYIQTLVKLVKIRIKYDPDIYLLGFRGHEIFWPVRLITRNKPLIFDSFVSPSQSLIEESRHGLLGRAIGNIIRILESRMLKACEFLLTDTKQHSNLFIEEFGVKESRVRHIYVGADPLTPALDSIHRIQPAKEKESLSVLFYGTFLPLHGIETILDAARILTNTPILFTIIGGNEKIFRKLNRNHKSSDSKNIKYYPWVDFAELRDSLIPAADVCLAGPFGGTPQARRVISGKTFQFLASSKVTVIGIIEEEVGFVDRVNCLLVRQKDPIALAEILRWTLDHKHLIPDIGKNARDLYCDKFDIPEIAANLSEVIELTR